MANNEKLVVTTYIINKGQPSQYFGLKTLEGDVLHYAPNNWKTEQGAYAWAKKKGYIVKDAKIKDNTFDNVKQVYMAQDKNGKVYYVYEGDYKDYKGTRHIFAVSSQTPEYVKSERNVAGTILPTKEEALKQLKMTVRDEGKSVKTVHSKLRDFDDTKKNINVVREFITNNGGKFSKSKDADAILDFIYKKTGVRNADYGDVLYIIRNYTNVKVTDGAVGDSISKYNGEDAIKINGFVKIKEDGDWTSYQYNGSDFDNAVFKIHQYNPSLIAFISNGNRTITVRNKYLKDASVNDLTPPKYKKGQKFSMGHGIYKSIYEIIGYDPVRADSNRVEYSYRIKTPGGTYATIPDWSLEKMIELGRYKLVDSAVKDVSFVSGKRLKVGQKIVEDREVLEVIDIKETQRGINNNYREITFKNIKTGSTETINFGNNQLAKLNDKLIQSSSKEAFSKNMATEIKSGKDPKQAAAIAYSVQRANDSISQYKPGMDTTGLWQVSHIKNNINQSLLVRANSKEEAINKVVKYKPNSEIIGVNEYPIPHFGEPILDSSIKDAIVNKKFRKGAGSDIRALCIKNDWYTSGTISDYDKLLTGVDSGWTVNEAALDIAKHSSGVKPIDVVHAIEQYDSQRHFLQDSRVKADANISELSRKASQLKNKLKKERAHSYENWGQKEIRQLKDLVDYTNYAQSNKIINEFINWVDERMPGKIGDAKPYSIKYKDKQYKVYAKDEQTAVEKLNNLLNKVTDEPIKWRTEDDPLYQDWKKDYQKLLHISIASKSAYAQYHDIGAKEQELKSYIDEYNKIIDKWKFGDQFKLDTKKEPKLARLDTFKQSIQNRYNIKPKINGQY